MSSCVASCSTCCRVASSASGTLASSPAAAAGRWFHFASNCFQSLRPQPCRHRLTPTRDPIRLRSGPARDAAALCSWSSVSLLFRSSYVLRRKAKLPEMLKPIHCRSFNASASDRYSCASVTAILRLAGLLIVLRPEIYFPMITRCPWESASTITAGTQDPSQRARPQPSPIQNA